jgi:hypothetical protein
LKSLVEYGADGGQYVGGVNAFCRLLEVGHHQEDVLLDLTDFFAAVKESPRAVLGSGGYSPVTDSALLGSVEVEPLSDAVVREGVGVVVAHS